MSLFKYTFLLVPALLSIIITAGEAPPVIFDKPLSDRVVSYKISARYEEKSHEITAEETLTWINKTNTPVYFLMFHLYMNGFANNKTIFMTESEGTMRGSKSLKDDYGYCQIASMKAISPFSADLTSKIKVTDTVAHVDIPEAINPGEAITLKINFKTKFIKVFARAGYGGDFIMAGQWFPKIAVFEGEKGWNCHYYHLNSEFYADFGVFDVDVTLPSKFKFGATGIEWKTTKNKDGTITHFRHIEDVHDFAWTANPHFIVKEDSWEGMKITVLMDPKHLSQADRYINSLKIALNYYKKHFEKFPYPVFTIVDPPEEADGAFGMEYPTLICTGTFLFAPKGMRFPEMVTIHEFGHNYFYGILASNEFEEAWLDEGINTYCEGEIMDEAYGENGSAFNFKRFKISDRDFQWFGYISAPWVDPMERFSWNYASNGTYSVISYNKTGLALKTLQGYLGKDRMDKAMRTYYNTWKFRHPHAEDFISSMSEGAGEDLSPILHPLIYTTKTVDYSVGDIRTKTVSEEMGYFTEKGKMVLKKSVKSKKKKMVYRSEVKVYREGELVFPVAILFKFEGGEVKRINWDAKDTWIKFIFKGGKRLDSVQVDPDSNIPIDLSRLNNSKRRLPDKLPAQKSGFSIFAITQIALSVILGVY